MSSAMKNNAVDELKNELSNREILNEQDLLEVLPLAARLAALGDPAELERCRIEATDKFGDKIGTLLLERAEEGIWDIENAFGEHLGLSIVEAQDFYCLMHLELGESVDAMLEERALHQLPANSFIPEEAIEPLVTWVEECEYAEPDADAVDILELFLSRFSLPAHFRLGILDSPVPAEHKDILAAMARPRTNFTAAWSEVLPERKSLRMAADAGKPPPLLTKRYEVMKKAPDGTQVIVARLINEKWEMLLDIHDPDEKPLRIDLVRAGTRPAFPIQGSCGISWKIKLADVPAQERLSAVFEPLVICFSNHTRLIINGRSD